MGRILWATVRVLLMACCALPALGQQPGQRILPRTSPPSDGPSERAVCAPSLDEESGLFSHSGKEFHGNEPSPDWLARQLFLISDGAPGPFAPDLTEGARAEYDRLSRGREPLPFRVPRSAFLGSRARWEWYRGAVARAVAPESPKADAEPLAEVDKREYFPTSPAPVVWSSSAGPWALAPPWTFSFVAAAGDIIGVVVDDVKPAPGYWWPDPVAWLIRVDEEGDPERGVVVALSDDGDSGLPALSHAVLEAGLFRVIVAPYSPASAGLISTDRWPHLGFVATS